MFAGRQCERSLNVKLTFIWRWTIRSVNVSRTLKPNILPTSHQRRCECPLDVPKTLQYYRWSACHVLSWLLPFIYINKIRFCRRFILVKMAFPYLHSKAISSQLSCPHKRGNFKQIMFLNFLKFMLICSTSGKMAFFPGQTIFRTWRFI